MVKIINEELIKQYTREAYRAAYGRDIPPYNDIGKFAKELLELHHARHVAPLVEAATKVCARWSFYDDTTLMADLRTALAPFQQENSND